MKPEPAFQFHLAEPFPHLANAPIVEAVVQWVARAEKPLEPDGLRRQLAERLPDYPECHPQRAFMMQAQFGVDGSSSHLRQDAWVGFRLSSADKLHVIQVSRDGVAFSRLKPYGNWDSFSSEATRIWKVYFDVARPGEIQRLGVRFINRIAPAGMNDLAKYLARPPKILSSLGLPQASFLLQSRHEVPGHPFEVNVIQTIQPPAPPPMDGAGLILDIDAFTTHAISPTDDLVADYLAKLRWLKDKVFFSLLKQGAVKYFQGETK